MKPLVLITGGHTGIGLGIARQLVAEGYALALVAETSPTHDSVVTALADLAADVHYYQHDLTEVSSVPMLLDQVEAKQGAILTLISNAGVSVKVRGDMLDASVDSFDFVMDINLRGAFFLAQDVARRMVSRIGDAYQSIVFITSVNAEMASKERAEYCISKAGAAMMAKLYADRLAAEGIGVFDLRPGIIETSMTAGVKDKYNKQIDEGLVPAARWGKPSDIGKIVVPLVQGKMAFANGAIIPVDGGLSIPRL